MLADGLTQEMEEDATATLVLGYNATKVFPVIVRFIRSFQHRNVKNLIVSVEPGMRTEEAMELMRKELRASKFPNVFKNFDYDTLKIECQYQGAKSNDAVINTSDNPSLTLKPGLTLHDQKVRTYTELSFFCNKDYTDYIQSPRELPKQ